MAIEARDLQAKMGLRHIIVQPGDDVETLVSGDESVVDKFYDRDDKTWHVLTFRARLTEESKALVDTERVAAEAAASDKISEFPRP